jgi:hypothetical protein
MFASIVARRNHRSSQFWPRGYAHFGPRHRSRVFVATECRLARCARLEAFDHRVTSALTSISSLVAMARNDGARPAFSRHQRRRTRRVFRTSTSLLLVGLSGCSAFADPASTPLNNVAPNYLVLSRSQQTDDQVRARAAAICAPSHRIAQDAGTFELGDYQFERFTCSRT